MELVDLLGNAARSNKRKTAVICGVERLAYPDLAGLAARCAENLTSAGARPGDRVAALFPNCHLYLATYFAALQSRLVLVPINLRLHPKEIRQILRHSGSRLLIGDPQSVARVFDQGPLATREGWVIRALDEFAGEAPADAVAGAAQLYYTSGTTGSPKGVILTRDNLAAHAAMTIEELAFTGDDTWLHAAPMFHLADAWAVWTVTAVAGTHVMMPRYDPDTVFDRIESAGVTITNLVPTMLLGLLEAASRRGRGLPSLRLLLSGGAPISPSTVARVEDLLGSPYAQTYGLTETSPFLTFSLLDEKLKLLPRKAQLRQRARTGRAARGIELRVVHPPGLAEFRDVPADDASVGEVVVRGPTITPGYWRDEESTRLAFLGGWFHTGDLGTIDRYGFVNLVDRARDVIITGGENVYSIEVENALYEHAEVLEVAVFGIPDETWGETVRAAVVLRESGTVSPAGLIAFCRERIARFKCPRAVDLVEALPRTGSGKIDKKALRAPFRTGP